MDNLTTINIDKPMYKTDKPDKTDRQHTVLLDLAEKIKSYKNMYSYAINLYNSIDISFNFPLILLPIIVSVFNFSSKTCSTDLVTYYAVNSVICSLSGLQGLYKYFALSYTISSYKVLEASYNELYLKIELFLSQNNKDIGAFIMEIEQKMVELVAVKEFLTLFIINLLNLQN